MSKWDSERSQQMRYKVIFENKTDSEAYIVNSVFILQSVFDLEKIILWQNPTTSSQQYCRPKHIKETTDIK